MLPLRFLSPALLDFSSFSCKTIPILAVRGVRVRGIQTSAVQRSDDNKDYKVSPLFENRNPRCLEVTGHAPKRKGWKFQAPKKDFYLKLVLSLGREQTSASLIHWKGNTVIKASTQEPFMAQALYSQVDVSAAWNVGRLMARRMLESGLTTVFFDLDQIAANSEKCEAFLKALQEANITFEEPAEIENEDIPGINYDGYNRYREKRRYQDDYQKL